MSGAVRRPLDGGVREIERLGSLLLVTAVNARRQCWADRIGNQCKPLTERGVPVVGLGIAVVRLPVAVWTQRLCIADGIQTALGKRLPVMHLKVRGLVCSSKERCLLLASLTNASCSEENFCDHVRVT